MHFSEQSIRGGGSIQAGRAEGRSPSALFLSPQEWALRGLNSSDEGISAVANAGDDLLRRIPLILDVHQVHNQYVHQPDSNAGRDPDCRVGWLRLELEHQHTRAREGKYGSDKESGRNY